MSRFGNLAVSSDTFTRPANTTAYAAGDAVIGVEKTITAASNASPIVLTSTAHGLVTGDAVTVASVGGNTAANGNFVVTKVTDDTFSLDGSVGNGAYTSGGTAVRLLKLGGLVGSSGSRGRVVKTKLLCDLATITNGTFRVHFFSGLFTQGLDNAAFTLLYADRADHQGYSGALTLVTEGSGSDAGVAQDFTSIPFICASGQTFLYAAVVAEGAYTPKSGGLFLLEVTVDRY